MNFESLMLRSLFIATLLACGLAFVAMFHPLPQGAQLASTTGSALLSAAPVACALPADGVVCPLQPAG
jgi:hypothetical protein